MGGPDSWPDTFGHTGSHGAYMLQEGSSMLVVDSSAKAPFLLHEGGSHTQSKTTWSYNDGQLTETKSDGVCILSDMLILWNETKHRLTNDKAS